MLAPWAREEGLDLTVEELLLRYATSDNEPAVVWINRRHDRPGWGATPAPPEEWSYDLEFTSMADFADAVELLRTPTPGVLDSPCFRRLSQDQNSSTAYMSEASPQNSVALPSRTCQTWATDSLSDLSPR